MDVCGPMPETSLGGSRYMTTVLDDCTGLSAVAFTETKDTIDKKVPTIFEALENIAGRRIKEVRTDREREFVNQAMGDYVSNKGIIHGTTVGYTPKQNGAAECLNRTLLEKTRAMLVESELPQQLWAEALVTANYYLRNISPITGAKVTLHEAFMCTKPDISHLRVFGCAAYAHVPKEKHNKLQPMSRKGTFVGYEHGGHYRILFDDGSIIKHSAVRFDETAIGNSRMDSDDDEEEADDDAGMVLPSGGGGGTLDGSNMDIELAENNSGPSASSGQTAPPRGQANMPLALFPRTHNTEQSRGGGGNGSGGPSTSGGQLAPPGNVNN
ncbi:hypothetical protein Vretifemale_9564, partial [Volvox reticuliferus]